MTDRARGEGWAVGCTHNAPGGRLVPSRARGTKIKPATTKLGSTTQAHAQPHARKTKIRTEKRDGDWGYPSPEMSVEGGIWTLLILETGNALAGHALSLREGAPQPPKTP